MRPRGPKKTFSIFAKICTQASELNRAIFCCKRGRPLTREFWHSAKCEIYHRLLEKVTLKTLKDLVLVANHTFFCLRWDWICKYWWQSNKCFLFCIDFIVVLSRLGLLQVVHVAHPRGVVPDNMGIIWGSSKKAIKWRTGSCRKSEKSKTIL